MVRTRSGASRRISAPRLIDAFEHAGRLLRCQPRADARAEARRARQPRVADGREALRAPHLIPFREVGREVRSSASVGDGGGTPSAASEVAGNSVSGGKCARLMPMPMASQSGSAAGAGGFEQDAGDLLASRPAHRWAISP